MAPPRSAIAAKLAQAQDDPTLLPSEDEDDSDFQLSGGEGDDGGSDSSDSEREDDNKRNKRVKLDEGDAAKQVEPVLTKSAVDDLWASFNDPGLDDPYSNVTASTSTLPQPQPATAAKAVESSDSTSDSTTKGNAKGKGKANLGGDEDMVKIKVEYKFAGETISQDKMVPRSSTEAQAYFALHPELAPSHSSATLPHTDPTTASLDALSGPESSTTTPQPDNETSSSNSATSALNSSSTLSKPPIPKPGPNRPKKAGGGGLGAMAASLGLGANGKPAKLNTLEKSKLDWNSYVSTQEGLSDTLTHARKDGYLEKKDFLDRVEQRKEQGWEESKGGRNKRNR